MDYNIAVAQSAKSVLTALAPAAGMIVALAQFLRISRASSCLLVSSSALLCTSFSALWRADANTTQITAKGLKTISISIMLTAFGVWVKL